MSSEKDTEEAFITKIFTNDDHSLKLFGELLSNQVSRDIIRLLIEKEMYANEIANKLDIQFNLISHHLKKMGELGLLSVNEKRIVKKGQMHKYYKINPGIFLLPNHTKEEINENGFLKKFFKDSVKFTSVGFAILSTWFLSKQIHQNDGYNFKFSGDSVPIFSIDWFYLNYETWIPIVVVSGITLLSIILKIKTNN